MGRHRDQDLRPIVLVLTLACVLLLVAVIVQTVTGGETVVLPCVPSSVERQTETAA